MNKIIDHFCFRKDHSNQMINFNQNDSNITEKIVRYTADWLPPFILEAGEYACGPFIAIVHELWKQFGYSLSGNHQINWFEDDRESIKNKNLSIALYPLTYSNKEQIIETLGFEPKLSRPIGLQFEGHILSGVRVGTHNLFEFIYGFETPVWIALILTILLYPSIFALADRSWSQYLNYFSYLLRLILTEVIIKLPKSVYKRCFLTFWLLSCTVLLSGFAGVLREFFIKSPPIDVIDSWEQLYNRKDLRIATTFEMSFISHFAHTYLNDNEMAQDFNSRIEEFLISDFYTEYFDKTVEGKYVLSAQTFELENILRYVNRKNVRDFKKVHISREGGAISPYFIPLIDSIDSTLERDLNKIIVRSIESGIYYKWLVTTKKMYGVPQTYNENNISLRQCTRLSFERLLGLFIILLSGSIFSLILLIGEFLAAKYLQFVIKDDVINLEVSKNTETNMKTAEPTELVQPVEINFKTAKLVEPTEINMRTAEKDHQNGKTEQMIMKTSRHAENQFENLCRETSHKVTTCI